MSSISLSQSMSPQEGEKEMTMRGQSLSAVLLTAVLGLGVQRNGLGLKGVGLIDSGLAIEYPRFSQVFF